VRIGYVPQKIEADRHLPLTYRDLFISKCKILKIRTEVIDRIGASVGLSEETLELPVGHLSGGYFICYQSLAWSRNNLSRDALLFAKLVAKEELNQIR